jgi:hypothetical protein
MNQKNQLNLASLHERQEEIFESEMKVVVAGTNNCTTCIDVDSAVLINTSIEAGQCACGSVWVIFGLML